MILKTQTVTTDRDTDTGFVFGVGGRLSTEDAISRGTDTTEVEYGEGHPPTPFGRRRIWGGAVPILRFVFSCISNCIF